jgi:pilus assembly protein CpaF
MDHKSIYQRSVQHFLAPIQGLLQDNGVTEVLINGPDEVFFEQGGKLRKSNCRFASDSALMAALRNIAEYAGRRLDETTHSMEARLPTGERVHAVVPPASRSGICVTIRKFSRSLHDLQALVKLGSLSPMAAEFVDLCVLLHRNIVVAGGTGTGKTSLLNALSRSLPRDERIIVIEDSSELRLEQPHTLYLEAQGGDAEGRGKVTIRDLFVDSLRMRPDRIIVGEVRRGEALDLVQSMISGHSGSLTTVHADTPRSAAIRLETLCLLSDADMPQAVARLQVASAIQLVVQLARFADGSRRITDISEPLELDDRNNYRWRRLFEFRAEGVDDEGRIRGELAWTGEQPTFASEVTRMGYANRVHLCRSLFGLSDAERDS